MTDPIPTPDPKPSDNPQPGTPAPAPADNAPAGGDSFQLPDKFKGKSAEDIAKSYLELEKSIGSKVPKSEVEKRDTELSQWKALGRVIANDPVLKEAVMKRVSGGQPKDQPKRDDVRLATENTIIDRFEQKYGIDKLDSEKRKDLHGRIGRELAEMIDPSGEMPLAKVLEEIPLDRLPVFLDKAYKLATVSDETERARSEGYVRASQNNAAAFGSMPSSSINPDSIGLSATEKVAAKRMGISEEDYLKEKKALLKERGEI